MPRQTLLPKPRIQPHLALLLRLPTLTGGYSSHYKTDSTVAEVALGELSLLLKTLGLSEEHIQADELSIDELLVKLQLPRTSAPDSTVQPEASTPDSLKMLLTLRATRSRLADFSINNSQIAYQVGAQGETGNSQQLILKIF